MINPKTSHPGQGPLNPEQRLFATAIQHLLQPGNPDFPALMAFIHARLAQFRLTGRHDPSEILNMAYERGIKFTGKGVSIQNPLGWLRRTIFNIVRELSRKDRKADSLDEEGCLEPVSKEPLLLDSLVRVEAIELLHVALEQLNDVDRELLELRYLQGLSWLEVGQCMAIAHTGKQTEATLRQRGHRALKRLRVIYSTLSDG